MLMYMHKLCVKCHSCEFFDCLDREFLNREISTKARADLSGKFAPREINPLYDTLSTSMKINNHRKLQAELQGVSESDSAFCPTSNFFLHCY